MWTAARIAACVIGLCAAAAAVAQTAMPAALTSAVAATAAAKTDYAFDVDLDTAKQNWRARFNPDARPRLTLVQPRREELDRDDRRAFDSYAESMEGVSWCAGEGMGRVRDVRLLREDETTATYAFQPTPESIRSEQSRRFAHQLRGEMTLTKANPDITRMRIYTPAAFSPAPLVRIDRVNVTIVCDVAPNGRRYAAETISEVSGSALGQDFSERSVQRARNLR